jgi:hypothetical protein
VRYRIFCAPETGPIGKDTGNQGPTYHLFCQVSKKTKNKTAIMFLYNLTIFCVSVKKLRCSELLPGDSQMHYEGEDLSELIMKGHKLHS